MNEVAISTHDSVMEERPFAMPSSKLVMWLFIISDAITFGALLFAYGYLRNATPNWPTPFKPESIVNVMIMTFILISSSLTILLGERAAWRDDKIRSNSLDTDYCSRRSLVCFAPCTRMVGTDS